MGLTIRNVVVDVPAGHDDAALAIEARPLPPPIDAFTHLHGSRDGDHDPDVTAG